MARYGTFMCSVLRPESHLNMQNGSSVEPWLSKLLCAQTTVSGKVRRETMSTAVGTYSPFMRRRSREPTTPDWSQCVFAPRRPRSWKSHRS